jgi:hypothetical protein
VGFLLLLVLLSPFAAVLPLNGERALADLALVPVNDSSPLRITSPTDSATVGDGNLLMLEAEDGDAGVDRVEFALGTGESWVRAQRRTDQPNRWAYVWPDPTTGFQRIRARAFASDGKPMAEQSVIVQVADVWSSPYVLDNPYAGAGVFHKGQVHVHSTNSFDGWLSLPPAELASEYKRRGYHFIMVTDHDVVSTPKEVEDRGFVVIPGYESTSDAGHITGAFAEQVVSPALPAQQRIDGIRAAGGMAILNHPLWQVGWRADQVNTLQGYTALEIYNGKTGEAPERGLKLWHDALNRRGWNQRIWAMAVDDAHAPNEIDRGWIVVKVPQLTAAALRQGLEKGAFYASNGPSFGLLGVLSGAITASSPDASTIRFIDQDQKVLGEGPATGTSYRPKGNERWIRVEAVTADGHGAWSQPFWLTPNAPRAELVAAEVGKALTGVTVPGARVHVSDNGQYLGSTVANAQGSYVFAMPHFAEGPHDYWVMATAPWPDQIDGPPTLLSYGSRSTAGSDSPGSGSDPTQSRVNAPGRAGARSS